MLSEGLKGVQHITPIHTWTTVQMDGKQTGNTAAEEVETAKTDSKMVEVK